jgi:hypothetical protein
MKWTKLGRIFNSNGQQRWMMSHASVPTPEHIRDDLFRVYFSPRDDRNRSYIGYIVIDLSKPQDILEISGKPVLEPGALGAFDDSGAMCSWLLRRNGERVLYYIGWTLGITVPWSTAIGIAYCSSNGPPVFERGFDGPIIGRSICDPFFAAGPFVLEEGAIWRMWYLSGTGWADGPKGPVPRYNLRYAESQDGVRWKTTGRACIDHKYPGEVAIARPCVIKDKDIYRMWFCYRGDDFGYKIGYAESFDGVAWERLDHQEGLEHSESGWDSEMTAYPCVFDHKGERYMLYCGNNYGATGFGLAVLHQ